MFKSVGVSQRENYTLLIQAILIDYNYKTMIIKSVVYDLQHNFTTCSHIYVYIINVYII